MILNMTPQFLPTRISQTNTTCDLENQGQGRRHYSLMAFENCGMNQ